MPISTKCPHCAAYDSFPDAESGKSVNCPACGGSIPLPFKARPVAAAVVAQAKPIAAKPISKPAPDLDAEDEDRPRKKSKPVMDLDDEDEERPRKKKSKPVVDVEEDEDRPRKKKSKVVVDPDEEPAPAKSEPELTFDDDVEEAPKKKKSRLRAEDDEDDERPRRKPVKKSGGGKLLLILGGVAFLLLAVCGGGALYFYMQWNKGVADLNSRTELPSPAEPTSPTGGKRKVKETVQTVSSGESHAALLTKMGPATVARISDLEEIFNSFNFGTGTLTKADLQLVLDAYAPWVDRGRGLMYRDGANVRALIVFSGIGADKKDWKVHGVLWLEHLGDRTDYYERIGFARNPSGDSEAQKLGLKGYKNFRVDEGAVDGPGGLMGKVQPIKMGDSFKNIRASLGRSTLYTLAALKADMAKYKKAGAESSVMGPLVADSYAPWIARECALVWREGDLTVVAAFNSPPFKLAMADVRAVKGLFWFDDKGGAAEFAEPIPVPSDLAADPDAKALGLKPYVDLKEVGGTVPVVPKPSEVVKLTAAELAAEVFKDRAAAAKKYAGVTLQITGVIIGKSGTGASLSLKGWTDEDTMKTLFVAIVMKADQREAAKAVDAGDTVTVTGTLGIVQPNSAVIPLREGSIKK